MGNFEQILKEQVCIKDNAIKLYLAFRKSKTIITMEAVKNLYYYADLFYKILSSEDFKDEEAAKDMSAALCHIAKNEKKLPLMGYWQDYRLFKYVYKKHRNSIEPYWESHKIVLSVI